MKRFKRSTTSLQPTYPGHLPRPDRPPNGYSRMPMSIEQKRFLEQMALEIFSDMSNNRTPFIETLSAILLTGMEWGAKVSSEGKHD